MHVHGMPDEDATPLESPAGGKLETADAYADATSWGYRLAARLDYNNAIGAANLFPYLQFGHDVSGNSPDAGRLVRGRPDRADPRTARRLSQPLGGRHRLHAVRGQGQRAERPRLRLRLRQVLVLRFRGHERHESRGKQTPFDPGVAFALGCAVAFPAAAEIGADEIARLGRDLTPLGGERAGNADGTIPEWTGGITEPPPGYVLGEHHRDPYAGDRPLFVINAANLDEHRDRLCGRAPAHAGDLSDPSKCRSDPARRSASVPQRIYDATRTVAATAKLVDDGNGVGGAAVGIPFPIPGNGLEVIWNHLLRYRGRGCGMRHRPSRGGPAAAPTTWSRYGLEIELRYSLPGMTPERLGNTMILFKQKVLAPGAPRGRPPAGCTRP